MSRRWKRTRVYWICPCDPVSCDNSEFTRMSNPKSNRRMALPQASPDPLWPLSLVCNLFVWPAKDTVYPWSWHQASEAQGCHCISRKSSWILDYHHRRLQYDGPHNSLLPVYLRLLIRTATHVGNKWPYTLIFPLICRIAWQINMH